MRDETPVLASPLNISEGYMDIPTGPGLGIELDMDAVKKLSDI